jgi:hypothetical protein
MNGLRTAKGKDWKSMEVRMGKAPGSIRAEAL